MAAMAVSLVVGPLVSLAKKASNYLLDKYKVMEGMEKQHEILKDRLPAILDVIADAEKQAPHRPGVKPWLTKLKMAAYEANEVFDEFEYEALRRRAKKEGHISKLNMAGRVKLFPTHNSFAFRIKMGNKLRRIVDTFEDLVTEMNKFGFNRQLDGASGSAPMELRENDSVLVNPENIVGRSREMERKKIVEVLVNGQQASNNGELMVVPLVGMGGLGKTTLAQLIYDDPQVKECFQLLKWVCVSDDFNVCRLANKICNTSETIVEEALKKLQQELRGKRYILVLDDVWNENNFFDKWEKLKACLKHGAMGSVVLLTTRDKEIAEFMGTVVGSNPWTGKYHDVESLGKEFIEEIIERRSGLFNLPKSERDELANLVGPIAERCVGSPLAAKALGSVLHGKCTKLEWEDVLHRSSICTHETDILPILKLSYDDLPSDMRQCFAFCAIYPKDYEIDADNLIQLWMANGFISDKNTIPAETVGERIVKEMVSRSFFQHVDKELIWISGYISSTFQYLDKDFIRIGGYSSRTFLKIHDLMHDVAVSASEEECVCITNEMSRSNELLPSAARHVLFENSTHTRGYSMGQISQHIQTLMFDKYYNRDVQCSSKHSYLRVLSMPMGRHDNLLKPKHQQHLRYLDLSNNDMEELPDDISILYNLQTLKLSGCQNLKRLPQQLKYMTSLHHLYTNGCYKLECMPPELGRLTFLRTVTCFVVGSSPECSGLGELKDLNIGGSLELKQLENVADARNAKAANLGNKKELRRLSVEWTRGKEQGKNCQEVLEALNAHVGLLALKISSYQGTSFPSWMDMLQKIVVLQLLNCRETKQLPPLSQLPELLVLELEGLEKLQFLCGMCTPSTFGKLKNLSLSDLDNFDGFCQVVQGERATFPQLEVLYIGGCKKMKRLQGEAYGGGDAVMPCSTFPSLKELTLSNLCRFERWDAVLEFEEEQPLFPLLETCIIRDCPKLTTLPRAPKIRELEVGRQENQRMSLGVAAGYLTSLSYLSLRNFNVDGKEKWDHLSSSVTYMILTRCDGFFLQPGELALWACFGQQLQDLMIEECDELIYWPEKEFQSLVSLRGLKIHSCNSLIGYAPGLTPSERNQLLPRLESIQICDCNSLVEVFINPALKEMNFQNCSKIVSLSISGQLQDTTSLNQGPNTDMMDELSEVVNLPSSLLEISICNCPKLRSLSSGQLDALKDLRIFDCPELRSLDWSMIEFPVLETLELINCKNLALPLPSGPQEYSSLRRLRIEECPGIKSLPSALQQRLDSLDYKALDARYEDEGPGLLGRIRSSLSPSCLG